MSDPHELALFDFNMQLSSPIAKSPIELHLMVLEYNLYEDIFSNFMKIEVLISDAIGLIDKFPIIGNEDLLLTYGLAEEEIFQEKFKIYRVSNRSIVKARQHSIVLHGITYEGYRNSIDSVYRPYIDYEATNIVYDLFYEHLQPWYANQEFNLPHKEIFMPIKSSNQISRVSTGQNPAQVINMIAAEAQSSTSKDYETPSNYLFYEDNRKFNFVPLDFLIAEKNDAEIPEFFLAVPQDKDQNEKGENSGERKPGAFPSRSIISFKFVEQFDHLDSAHRGAFQNEVNVIDPIMKRFKMHPMQGSDQRKHQFKYNRDFDNLTHLPFSGFKMISPNSFLGRGTKPGATHRRMMISQLDNDIQNASIDKNQPYDYYRYHPYLGQKQRVQPGDQIFNPRVRHKYLPESIHEKENLFSQVVEVTVPGDPKLTCGMHIRLKVPQPTITDEDHQEFIRLFGQEATFLITAVRNMYKGDVDAYYMVLSCSAESFGVPPVGKNVLPVPEVVAYDG